MGKASGKKKSAGRFGPDMPLEECFALSKSGFWGAVHHLVLEHGWTVDQAALDYVNRWTAHLHFGHGLDAELVVDRVSDSVDELGMEPGWAERAWAEQGKRI